MAAKGLFGKILRGILIGAGSILSIVAPVWGGKVLASLDKVSNLAKNTASAINAGAAAAKQTEATLIFTGIMTWLKSYWWAAIGGIVLLILLLKRRRR